MPIWEIVLLLQPFTGYCRRVRRIMYIYTTPKTYMTCNCVQNKINIDDRTDHACCRCIGLLRGFHCTVTPDLPKACIPPAHGYRSSPCFPSPHRCSGTCCDSFRPPNIASCLPQAHSFYCCYCCYCVGNRYYHAAPKLNCV